MSPYNYQRQMQIILNSLGYDFTQFSFDHFVHYLQVTSGKTFRFMPQYLITHDTFGAWLTSTTHEIFLYEITSPVLHRIQTILHELAHFICQHPTLTLTPRQLHNLLSNPNNPVMLPDLRFAARRTRCTDPVRLHYEQQAETLSDLIQAEAAAYSRLRQLQTAPENVINYFEQLGVGA